MNLIKEKQDEIYITGGAGLIGSFLCERLLDKGYKVFVVDDFSKGQINNLQNILNKVEIIEADLQDLSLAKKALSEAKTIYHLASRAYGVGYSSKNHIETLIHNEKITNNLVEIFEDTKPKKVMIASSSCVYKDDGPDLISEMDLFENNPEEVNRGYGWAKRFLEQKFLLLAEFNNLNLKIVRPFNIYGERYKWVGEYSSAIPMLVKKIMDNENPIYAWGSGKQRRSYMHASDCARIMSKIMDLEEGNITVNIGTEETISIAELVTLICKLSNKNPSICFDTNKPEGRFIKSSDSSYLRKLIKSELTRVTIEKGIIKMLNWYKKNFN